MQEEPGHRLYIHEDEESGIIAFTSTYKDREEHVEAELDFAVQLDIARNEDKYEKMTFQDEMVYAVATSGHKRILIRYSPITDYQNLQAISILALYYHSVRFFNC